MHGAPQARILKLSIRCRHSLPTYMCKLHGLQKGKDRWKKQGISTTTIVVKDTDRRNRVHHSTMLVNIQVEEKGISTTTIIVIDIVEEKRVYHRKRLRQRAGL